MSQELAIVEELAGVLVHDCERLVNSFSMRVKRLWIALAVPMVFDHVLDANGAFSAASFAIAALVFGGCWLADNVVYCTLEDVFLCFAKTPHWGCLFAETPRAW